MVDVRGVDVQIKFFVSDKHDGRRRCRILIRAGREGIDAELWRRAACRPDVGVITP